MENKKLPITIIIISLVVLVTHTYFNGAVSSTGSAISGPDSSATILYKLRPGSVADAAAHIETEHGIARVKTISQIGVVVGKVPQNRVDSTLLALKNNPNIEFVELDTPGAPMILPNDPFANGWNMAIMRWSQAWDISTGSAQVITAAPDTGQNLTLADLAPIALTGLAYNTIDGTTNVEDNLVHGSYVAGALSAATNNGAMVASNTWDGLTKLVPIKITNDPQGLAFPSEAAEGIIYAADHGAKVVSLSYSFGCVASISAAADYLASVGGVFFVAAGNSPVNGSCTNYPNVHVVSASNSSDAPATWTTYGTHVDFAAPGQSINIIAPNGCLNCNAVASGTSLSAPIAGSVAAYLYSVIPGITAGQVITSMRQGAVDIGPVGNDIYSGYGRVDALGALLVAQNLSSTPDTTAPTTSFVSPTNGQQVNGTISVSISAIDDVAVTHVDLWIDNVSYATDMVVPYSFVWNTNTASNGIHQLQSKAYDAAGNFGTASISVTVQNGDATAPQPTILEPLNGAVISGNGNFKVRARATDAVGVTSLKLYLNGLLKKTCTYNPSVLSTPDCQYNQAKNQLVSGSNAIQAVAMDAAGNSGTMIIDIMR